MRSPALSTSSMAFAISTLCFVASSIACSNFSSSAHTGWRAAARAIRQIGTRIVIDTQFRLEWTLLRFARALACGPRAVCLTAQKCLHYLQAGAVDVVGGVRDVTVGTDECQAGTIASAQLNDIGARAEHMASGWRIAIDERQVAAAIP